MLRGLNGKQGCAEEGEKKNVYSGAKGGTVFGRPCNLRFAKQSTISIRNAARDG